MLFNSFLFIFIFLPITLIGWYILNHYKHLKLAKTFLAGMSLWFYGYFNFYYLAIIIVSIVVNYLLSFILTFVDSKPWKRTASRIGLLAGITFNLGLLFYFKYYDFFIENINLAFHTDFNLKHILLPLGISFFTFQQLSFVIDRCLGRAEHYSFINYVTFVTFFPQLVAGPIVLYKEIIPQFEEERNHKFNPANFAEGIILFVLGLGKKVLLADVFGLVVNYGFAQTYSLDTVSTILVILSYTFEIYFDFSGYSDMAMGLGRMFNIVIPVNFNSPYRSCSVKELWQRWHITLSRFFVTYVYIPLGGSKKGKLRTVINTIIIFFLSGLWHGAAWTYIAWGTMQGLLVVWDNLGIVGISGREEKHPSKFHIPAWCGWFLTFAFFNLSLFFFRSESMAGALQMFKNLFAFNYTGKVFEVAAAMDIAEFYVVQEALGIIAPNVVKYAYLLLLVVYLAFSFFLIFRKNALEIATDGKLSSGKCWAVSIIFVWCVISLSQVSTFLYFNF
ncbi:MAG: MBOAT family protein [Lachnospiraceae bacterium]|nr:MBOAT family protein [Lachnospiraceae bacterium]